MTEKIRTMAAARRYVAGGVSASLTNDFDSGAHWLIAEDSDGNLADGKSEDLVQAAALELIEALDEFQRSRRRRFLRTRVLK